MTDDTISKAKRGDVVAFTDLVARHQEMVFGYALTILRDFHLAQDATQEAFVAAYFGLGSLEDPAKFPQWLRGITRHQCWRYLRRRHLPTVALDLADSVAASAAAPDARAEEQEGLAQIIAALDALPEALRAPALLFYLGDYSQREIAAALALPVTTVNNRLHAARKQLKERRAVMSQEPSAKPGLPADFAARVGAIIRARGPLVEARFDQGNLPPILNALAITDASGRLDLTASVAQHLPGGIARCVVLAAPASMGAIETGLQIRDTAKPADFAADAATAAAVAASLHTKSETTAVFDTGLKALDLLCPLPLSGTVGIFGDMGVGKAVLIAELQHDRRQPLGQLVIITFVQTGEEVRFFQPFAPTSSPMIEVLSIAVDQGTAFASPELTAALDTRIFLTRDLADLGLFPSVDPARSASRLLDPAIVGEEHYRVAQEVRALLARYPETAPSAESDHERSRARKLRRFLAQPMFVAESFTQVPGEWVSREETVRACAAILRGDYDALPEQAFAGIGRIEQAGALGTER